MTTHHNDEKCMAIFEKLSEYIDRELDGASCEEIERHLDDCQCCHACLETLKRTVALCRKTKPEPVPDTLSNRLKELLRDLQ